MPTKEELLADGGRVNHPGHYQHRGVECIEATRGMGGNLANAVKYVYRGPEKGDWLRDLLSARFYVLDHMRYAYAQIPVHPRAVDALRRIAQHCTPGGKERAFFFAVADGNYGDALAAIETLIAEAEERART
jgi:hypothetical protein